MKKSTIWFLAITMVITFVGLLLTQFMYMEDMIEMRVEQFKGAAQRSLYTVSAMLEEDEAQRLLTEAIENDLLSAKNDDALMLQPQFSITSPNGIVTTFSFNSQNLKDRAKEMHDLSLWQGSKKHQPMMLAYKTMQNILKQEYLYQRALIDDVIINLMGQATTRSILERVDTRKLETYLKTELENNGLNFPFEYAIIDHKGKVVSHSKHYDASVSDKMLFSQVIFPHDSPGHRNALRIYFPTQNDYILDSVRYIIPSIVFTFIMLVTFMFTIIIVFRQKKLTDMKNDFINNMTHEFKTPISTISLAAQMLNDPVMTKSPAMFNHISGVINDETKRLRLQVEKVLQMSMFDRQKTQLKLHKVDVNDLIAGVISTFKIKVEKFGGEINADLPPEDMIVAVDEMHFTNVIFNLLDNAVKYRREDVALSLFIKTRIIADDKVEISISDNGIGIRKDDLKKIFDKFYRVSTGNRHDVKGFGLGLAYVHKIIKDHKGDIRAESELNVGSTFIITLPLIKD